MSGPVLARIRVNASAPWIGPLYSFLLSFKPGHGFHETIMRRVMIYGLLAPIRKNFMSKLSQSLVMQLDNRRPQKKVVAEYIEGAARLRSIKSAYEALDEAYSNATGNFGGTNYEAIQKASERLKAAMDMRQAASDKTNEALGPAKRRMTLAAITSGLMKNGALLVLDALTNPANLKVQMPGGRGGDMVMQAGSTQRLDQIHTPSATAQLMRMQTSSEKKALWKHLEFGTGVLKSRKQVAGLVMNKSRTIHGENDGTWWYGQNAQMPNAGLKIRGSSPMDVLWGSDGNPLPEYTATAQKALEDAIEAFKPRLT